jgi:hypothetical protein
VIVPAPTIVCVECGGTCGLLQAVGPEDELEPGDVVAYRCGDCLDRFDLVLTEDDEEDGAPDGGTSGFGGLPV